MTQTQPISESGYGDLKHRRTAKGNRGIVANTRVACQKHTTKHHGGPAILAVLSDLDGAQDPISAGIGDAEPIAKAREGRALTRPPNQTQDLQAQVGESVDSTDASGIHTEICVTQFLDAGGREQPGELGNIYPEICEEEEMCGWTWPALRDTVHRWGRHPFP